MKSGFTLKILTPFCLAPGPLGLIHLPTGAFVRSDSAFTEAGEVSLHYDPMIAKISVWALTREEAIGRLRAALDETRVLPPKKTDGSALGSLRTNLSFLKKLVRNETVISGNTTTDLIAKNADLTAPPSTEVGLESALAVSLSQILSRSDHPSVSTQVAEVSQWAQIARQEGVRG